MACIKRDNVSEERKEGGYQSVNDNHGRTMQEGYGDILHGRGNDNGRGILRGSDATLGW